MREHYSHDLTGPALQARSTVGAGVSLSSATMCAYLPDTNVLIDFGRDLAVRAKLENAQQDASEFVIAPPVLIELVRGVIARGRANFERERKVFAWLHAHHFTVLELPRPFMAQILQTSTRKRSGAVPRHYDQLIDMIATSADFEEFLRRTTPAGSVWKEIANADRIHKAQLDKEFAAFEKLARARANDFANLLARTFGVPGCRPNPLILERRFSAAIEFLQSSLAKVRGGAKPRRNDPGLYVDFQLLLYLADPQIIFLTREDFSHEIKRSPQKSRIVGLESLR